MVQLRSFFDWYRERDAQRPWLMFGKGPSFAKRSEFDLSQYDTLGLNHVCREQPVTVMHTIDLDVIDACGDALFTNCDVVVMPWQPHSKNYPFVPLLPTRVSSKPLSELAEEHPILSRLAREGRLLWYNLSTGRKPNGDSPIVTARFFSAEAGLDLLALAGARTVRSLGIDGGATYSSEFDDLKDKTLLANKRSSFDRQFEGMAQTILRTGVDYAPLDVESPIRVYVATEEAQMLAVKVLEYSIRKHASMTVEVVPMHRANVEIPMPNDPRNAPRTPFSFQRFLVPQLAGYRGRAIYLDSDMQVFHDIRKLWTLPFDDAEVLAARETSGRRPQFSVMLIDCERARWDIRDLVAQLDSGALTYERLMYDLPIARVRAAIDPRWNSLETYEEGATSLVHYTDMHRQPWVTTVNRLEYLWTRDLLEAIDAGFITIDEVREHVERGYIRPSLLYQVEHRLESHDLVPRDVLRRDKSFAPPYTTLPKHAATGFRNPLLRLRAAARHYLHATGIARFARRVRDHIVK